MAIIIDKNTGHGDVAKGSYVRVENVQLLLDEGKLYFEVKTYLSKRARENAIMIDYCDQLRRDVYQEVEPEAGQLDKLGITQKEWDEFTAPGPWNYEELMWLDKNLFVFMGKPIQGLEVTIPVPEDFPKEITEQTVKTWIYEHMKDGNLWSAMTSDMSTLEGLENDFETARDVIERYQEEYPIYRK